MKDLLQTALLDAGLDFGDEDTAQNAEVKELPQLQKMTNCSDTPTASIQQPGLAPNIPQPAKANLNVHTKILQSTNVVGNSSQIQQRQIQLQRTVVTSNGRKLLVISPRAYANFENPVITRRPNQPQNGLYVINRSTDAHTNGQAPRKIIASRIAQPVSSPRIAQPTLSSRVAQPAPPLVTRALVQPPKQIYQSQKPIQAKKLTLDQTEESGSQTTHPQYRRQIEDEPLAVSPSILSSEKNYIGPIYEKDQNFASKISPNCVQRRHFLQKSMDRKSQKPRIDYPRRISQRSVNPVDWVDLQNEEIEEDEKLLQAETFIQYAPLKLRSGLPHPDPVVETLSLGSVAAPEIRYQMHIPEDIVDTGKISALQLEAALYACQAHERELPSGERVGYLIGDGAGVGKGRIIATIIYENYLLDRKRAIWISASADLYYDAQRDLRDIGAPIRIYQLSKLNYAKISSSENGKIKKGVLFLTYSALIGSRGKGSKKSDKLFNSRLDQVVNWCGEDFDGPIIFDESHQAKNLFPSASSTKPTKTGQYVLKLQKLLPKARVVYASATGASEPRNMAYMDRLGLWGKDQTFEEFGDFIAAVEDKGMGSIELIAIDMKLRGLYLARQLSFAGVDFNVQEVLLPADFVRMYDESAKLWLKIKRQFQYAIEHTRSTERSASRVWSYFWGAHQRFFKYLCIGAKVHACVQIAQQSLQEGKCVVIGLQTTGESHVKSVLDEGDEITDFVSTTKAVLRLLIENHFPTGDSKNTDLLEDLGRSTTGGESFYTNGRKRRGIQLSVPLAKRRNRQGSVGTPDEDEQSDGELEDEEEISNSDSISDSDESDDSLTDSSDDEDSSSDIYDINKPQIPTANNNSLYDTLMGELEDGPELEVDPFHHDFSNAVDPWAHLQKYQEDGLTVEQKRRKAERKERRYQKRIRRQERRLQKQKERKEAENNRINQLIKMQRKQELEIGTASEFMRSTESIGDCFENGEEISLITRKAELLAEVERLGKILPPNTLDQLIEELGGTEKVAEMTGRKGRIVSLPDGQVEYRVRNADSNASLDQMNMEEKENFMKGRKLVAVISEAASSGISLQSDKRVENRRRRVHITLELPWSADKAVQQFGRTHRSNQVNAPEYLFLISELAGEKRFVSTVAKRLECLGAITHGDRRATESRDLSQFNLENKYGRAALHTLVNTLADVNSRPMLPPPSDYAIGADKFFDDMREYFVGVGILSPIRGNSKKYKIESEGRTLQKFLNRVLGLPVHAQTAVFNYFTGIINELIRRAKAEGNFDRGIVDLGGGSDKAKKLQQKTFYGFGGNPNFVVELHKIGVERGVKWSDAKGMYDAQTGIETGFFISKPLRDRRQTIVLVVNTGKNTAKSYAIVRPNTGRVNKMMSFTEISDRFRKLPLSEAEGEWEKQYEAFEKQCVHRFVNGRCQKEDRQEAGEYCEFGRRYRTYFVLTGSVIAVWPMIEEALAAAKVKQQVSYMQIVRIRTEDNQKLVGLNVPPKNVKPILSALTKLCNRCV